MIMRRNKTTSIDKELHDQAILILDKQGKPFGRFVDDAMQELIDLEGGKL